MKKNLQFRISMKRQNLFFPFLVRNFRNKYQKKNLKNKSNVIHERTLLHLIHTQAN